MAKTQFLNPYGSDRTDQTRIQFWVSPEHLLRVRSVSPLQGFEPFLLSTFYKSFHDLLNTHGLSVADSKSVHDFILTLPAVLHAAGERHFQNVSRGAEQSRNPAPSAPHQPADNGQGTAGRGAGSGGPVDRVAKIAEASKKAKLRAKGTDGGGGTGGVAQAS